MDRAMLALIPSSMDAERLAVPEGEEVHELHLTLAYFAADVLVADDVVALAEAVQAVAGNFPVITAEGFAVDVFNPLTDGSCIVLGVTGEGVAAFHQQLLSYVDTARFPQHEPWIPHITLRWTDGMDNASQFRAAGELADRVGPIVFDRCVLAIGDEWYAWNLVQPDGIGGGTTAEPVEGGPVAQLGPDEQPLRQPEVASHLLVAGASGLNLEAQPQEVTDQLEKGIVVDGHEAQIRSADGGSLDGLGVRPLVVGHGSVPGQGEVAAVDAAFEDVEDAKGEVVLSVFTEPRDVDVHRDLVLPVEAALESLTAAVNSTGWSKLPVAERDTRFAFRAATDRLAAHATSIAQFSSWFFWRDPSKPANNRMSYRMPFADVFDDGTVKLVPNAVYSAAAQLSGAHGALPAIPDAEKEQIRATIDRIYAKFRDMWDDPRQIPPWERAASPEQEVDIAAAVGEEEQMPFNDMNNWIEPHVTAGIAPVRPPKAWFEDPGFTKPTRMRVTDDGRVMGHIATWNSCHRGMADRCTPPPRDRSNYRGFKTGTLMTAEGSLIAVGNLTYGGSHAPLNMAADAARDFYADAGMWFVPGNVGEDQFGPWFAGALPASATEIEAQALRAHPPSGDWRWTDGDYQMIAVLAVNTPGLPVPEEEYALAASMEHAAIIADFGHEEGCDCGTVTADAGAGDAEVLEKVAEIVARAEALRLREIAKQQRRIIDMELPVRS